MKSDTVLQCDQCENEAGTFVASDLDITYCRKIENVRGRLTCTSREVPKPKTEDNDNDAYTKQPDKANDDNDGLQADDDQKINNDDNNLPKKTTTEEPAEVEQEIFDDGLPAGSYRKDCTGCALKRDGLLLACDACQRRFGVTQYTVAYTSGCSYFVNKDGVLRCAQYDA